LDVGRLVASAVAAALPARLALGNSMWALSPLVEAGRTLVQASNRTYRVIVEIVGEAPSLDDLSADDIPETAILVQNPDQPLTFSVQDRDDGFRQRRWLVESYAARWNELVSIANSLDDESYGQAAADLRGWLEAECEERADTRDPARQVELDRLLVRHLAGLKVVEAWRSVGRVEWIDEVALREAVKADIHEVRPSGILSALAYDAASAGSVTALWGRDEADGRRPSTFTKDDFFRWARHVSGYNRAYVTDALRAFPPTARHMEGAFTKGSRGSRYPEILVALRAHGAALLAGSPSRQLWAQGQAGTTVDEQVRPERVILPRAPKRRKRR
jgi:hypothetical protein